MTKIQTTRYDVAEHLRTQEEMAAYLEACLEEADGDAAFVAKALGDKSGITRFSDETVPMDEALVLAAIDVSGRGELYWDVPIAAQKVGTFDTELGHEFFAGLARDAGITLHLRLVCGENTHHILEATFKAAARALREAVEPDPRSDGSVPSTKGSL